MYYLIGYAICLTFTVGLLAWVLVLRMHFSANVKKVLSGIIAVVTLLLSILFVSFIPFKWMNILFYIGLVIGYFLIVGAIYWIVHFIYGKIEAKRQWDDEVEVAENPSEQGVKKKAKKETVLSFDRSKKKPMAHKDEQRLVKQTVQKEEPKKDKQTVAQKSPVVDKTQASAKVNPKASAVTKKAAVKQVPAKKAEVSQQPPVFGKGYVRPVEEKTTKKPIPGPSAAEEARMARSQQRAQKPAPIKKRNNPFKK